ncbi:NHL repeat-containing protein [bacterium]|nr:NHL repeat-containing protein [bacterium]
MNRTNILILFLGLLAGVSPAHAAGIDQAVDWTPPGGGATLAAPALAAPHYGAPSFFGQPSDITADWVLGQSNFDTNADTGPGRGRIGYPMGAAHLVRGEAHYLFVADQEYHRVMVFSGADNLTNGQAADTVIGQGAFDAGTSNKGGGPTASSLSGPADLCVDAWGNLYVADYANHRVLIYRDPIGTDLVADSVLGQAGSFTSSTLNLGGRSASSLRNPVSVGVDAQGNVYVADLGNHRVLIYFDPLNSDAAADRVIGQTNFTDGDADPGGVVTSSSFDQPYRVRLDPSGNLYVTDWNNSRGLIFNSPLDEDGIADAVIGQPNFSSETENVGGLTAGIRKPCSLGVDAYANLYMADWGNTRVLYYRRPLAEDTLADVVFGQTDSTASLDFAVSAVSLSGAQRIDFDPDGHLYISDCYNSRLLKYRIAAVENKCPVPWITVPRTGQAVSGNAVSVIAHLAGSGKGVTIQFQYRKEPATTWAVLGADLPARPYLLKWNSTADGWSDGDTVWVRAAAFSADCDTTYSLPVRVTINRSKPDIEESEGDDHEKKEKVEKGHKAKINVKSKIEIDIPSSVLDTDAVLTVKDHEKNPKDKSPDGLDNAKGVMFQTLSFDTAPASFAESVTLTFTYPDADNDGVVDGTDIPETGVWVFWMGDADTEWTKLDTVAVNVDTNQVKGKVGHFSVYAVFGSAEGAAAVTKPKMCLLTRWGAARSMGEARLRGVRDVLLRFGVGRRIVKYYDSW